MGEEIVEMVDLRKSLDLKWRFQEGKVEKRYKIGKPWKGSAFVATTGKLYLFIRWIFLLSWHGNVKLGRKSSDVPLSANKHNGKESQAN
ncbi:hypothetical protein T12_11515 [Trichinella patagoniensis]|uniref:Uncharacterized protein n=1 Tax=Trichinella patagoniensis TaxID=990121 RepID=A0A0V1ABH2_9BILA|nr:hypothetical protein T12_11515 [Trichinella patagoniensis]